MRSCMLTPSRSQWSENGSETRRGPVTQLRTRQKTKPSVNLPFGPDVVSTAGSCP